MQQLNIFKKPTLLKCPNLGVLFERLEESREIVQKAINVANPYAIVVLVSGGDDSLTALRLAILLGVPIDFIMHGVTGTGLKDIRNFVHQQATKNKIRIIEANAGTTFEDYVDRKGFFGMGKEAHKFTYHLLKKQHFNSALSKYIRKGKKGRNIILINGVRVEESANRLDNYGDEPLRWQDRNLWVNIAHWFTKEECLQLLSVDDTERSPVAMFLGRSGECNCGTMQDDVGRIACAKYDPDWGDWMKRLRKHAIQKFGWDINQNPHKDRLKEIKHISSQLSDDMPMCVGCKAADKKLTLF